MIVIASFVENYFLLGETEVKIHHSFSVLVKREIAPDPCALIINNVSLG